MWRLPAPRRPSFCVYLQRTLATQNILTLYVSVCLVYAVAALTQTAIEQRYVSRLSVTCNAPALPVTSPGAHPLRPPELCIARAVV